MKQSSSVARACALSVLLLSVAALQGCATAQNKDPLEPFNRKIFSFNDAVDDAVLRPVATGYVKITPQPVRTGVTNFVNNIKDVWSAINLVLQGRPGEAAQEILRFSLNSTFGMAGFIDIARPMGLERHNEDFGQTLAVWGAPQGAYLVLPLLGPSTVRDVVGLPGDMYFSASRVFREPRDANPVTLLTLVNARSQALTATNLLGDIALDKYAFLRDAYLQRRQSLIYNGDPPDDDDVQYDDGGMYAPPDDAPAAPAAAPVGPQSLLMPEIAPETVVWRRELVLADDLGATLLPSPLAGQLLAAAGAGAGPAIRPALSGKTVFDAVLPTSEELRGLRADAGVR